MKFFHVLMIAVCGLAILLGAVLVVNGTKRYLFTLSASEEDLDICLHDRAMDCNPAGWGRLFAFGAAFLSAGCTGIFAARRHARARRAPVLDKVAGKQAALRTPESR